MSVTWSTPYDDGRQLAELEALKDDILRRTREAVDEAFRDSSFNLSGLEWREDPTLNAEVSKGAASSISIAVNLGTMLRVYAVFMALLTDAQFLPTVPFPEERPDLREFSHVLVKGHLLRNEAFNIIEDAEDGSELSRTSFRGAIEASAFDTSLLFLAPANRERSLTALALANLALDFVLWHELAHVARGHLDLLSSGRLQMAAGDASDDVDLLRLLEHDADSCAVLAWARGVIESGEGFAWSNLSEVLESEDRIMTYLVLSLCVLFIMFGAATSNSPSHPPPELRYWNAYAKLQAYFSATMPNGEQRWRQASDLALSEMDQLLERLQGAGTQFPQQSRATVAEVARLDHQVTLMGSRLRAFTTMERMRTAVQAWSERAR